MSRFTSLALVLFLAFSALACGSDDEDGDEALTVGNASSCEHLADASIPIMQTLLDAASEMTMADLTAEEPPEAISNFETRMNEVGERSVELNCSEDEIIDLLDARVDQLTASGPVGELLLEVFQEGRFR